MNDIGSTYPATFEPKENPEDFGSLKLILKNLKQVLSDNSKEIELLKEELMYQHEEKDKRAAELILANLELVYENNKKEKAASELVVANTELLYQNIEKEKRAAELIVANAELVFQNVEKEKRAAELIVANAELVFQNLEKEKRAAELLELNNELLSFTHISSHDLQEPLRKIQIFTECIVQEDRTILSDASKHHFSRIVASALQMQQLIDGLLMFSQITTTHREFEQLELGDFINSLDAELKAELGKRAVTLDISGLGKALIDKAQLNLVWDNLIDNSLKFSKPGITLQIQIKSEIVAGSELSNSSIAFAKEEKYCRITYSDNGMGFDPHYNDLVFGVFKRLNRKTDYPGIGMGLAIVKKIVKSHNGIIIANGEPDKGATFIIYLPVQ